MIKKVKIALREEHRNVKGLFYSSLTAKQLVNLEEGSPILIPGLKYKGEDVIIPYSRPTKPVRESLWKPNTPYRPDLPGSVYIYDDNAIAIFIQCKAAKK